MRKELQDGCINWFSEILTLIAPGWIAGGAVRDYFARTPHDSDVDVFFRSPSDLDIASKRLSDAKVRQVYDNDTVLGFSHKGREIQLIKRHFFAGPQETSLAFDFTVCCCAVDPEGVYVHEHFFEDLAGRRLALNKLPFPLSTLQRMQRYVQKGYLACNGTLLELSKAIQALDLNNPNENALQFYPNGKPRFMRFD